MSMGIQLKVQLEAQERMLRDNIKATRKEMVETVQLLHTLDEATRGIGST